MEERASTSSSSDTTNSLSSGQPGAAPDKNENSVSGERVKEPGGPENDERVVEDEPRSDQTDSSSESEKKGDSPTEGVEPSEIVLEIANEKEGEGEEKEMEGSVDSEAPFMQRLPSQQVITRQDSERETDVRVLQLLEMGFHLIKAELVVARLTPGDGLEQAVQMLFDPPRDLDEIFRSLSYEQAHSQQGMLRRVSLSITREVDKLAAAAHAQQLADQKDDNSCIVCYDEFQEGSYYEVECGHKACNDCWFNNTKSRVNDGEVKIKCIGYDDHGMCDRFLTDDEIRNFLREDDDLGKKYEKFLKNFKLSQNPNTRWCIKPGCETHMEGNDEKPKLKCPTCGTAICSRCRNAWHRGHCDREMDSKFKKYCDAEGISRLQKCPVCDCPIQKNGGCNHMTCTNCRYEFCWLCRRKYDRYHYAANSPNGCPGAQFSDERVDEVKIAVNVEQAEVDAANDRKEWRRRANPLAVCLEPHCFQIVQKYNLYIVPLVLPLGIIFQCFLLFYLEDQRVGNKKEPMSWFYLIPIIVALFIICSSFFCFHWARIMRWRHDPYVNATGVIPLFLNETRNFPNPMTQVMWFHFLMGIASFVFFFLNITGEIDFDYAWMCIFFPIYLATASLICAIAYFCIKGGRDDRIAAAIVSLISSPGILFVLLLNLRLLQNTPMAAVFAPVYLMIALSCCGLCLLGSDSEVLPAIGVCCTIILPIIIFVILLAVFLDSPDSGLNFWTVFIPVFFMDACFMVGCISWYSYKIYSR